jgi:hypothetical protein
MGLDTHMIAGSRACSTSIPAQSPDLTNQTNQHFAEALGNSSSCCSSYREVVGRRSGRAWKRHSSAPGSAPAERGHDLSTGRVVVGMH